MDRRQFMAAAAAGVAAVPGLGSGELDLNALAEEPGRTDVVTPGGSTVLIDDMWIVSYVAGDQESYRRALEFARQSHDWDGLPVAVVPFESCSPGKSYIGIDYMPEWTSK